jgi:hypothetical protein
LVVISLCLRSFSKIRLKESSIRFWDLLIFSRASDPHAFYRYVRSSQTFHADPDLTHRIMLKIFCRSFYAFTAEKVSVLNIHSSKDHGKSGKLEIKLNFLCSTYCMNALTSWFFVKTPLNSRVMYLPDVASLTFFLPPIVRTIPLHTGTGTYCMSSP